MSIKVGINGFGRIGRNILRALVESGREDVEVVAINDLMELDLQAHLLKYDSVHGRFQGSVVLRESGIQVGDQFIRCTSQRDPEALPWQDVDVALECTGFFTNREGAAKHLENGSRRVLVSAPASGADKTLVFGVNHESLEKNDVVISNGSCTTNCLGPMAMVLNDALGIEKGYMTTIHSYTGDQPSLDTNHSDPYRARAAALSMIPTTTGAARAIGLVLPELDGKLDGSAIRVPTPNVSLIDLSFKAGRETSVEEVNRLLKDAAEEQLNGILGYSHEPLVSSDFNHSPESCVIASKDTRVQGGDFVRVLGWYDNEWGFSNRMLDTASYIGNCEAADNA